MDEIQYLLFQGTQEICYPKYVLYVQNFVQMANFRPILVQLLKSI